MKNYILMATAILALTLTSSLQAGEAAVQGTWKMVSQIEPGESDYSDYPAERKMIKLITDTHWTWVVVSKADKKVQAVMGGTYTLDGNTYTETVGYLGQSGNQIEGMEEALGSASVFTVKVDGDTLHLVGTMANGLKLDEIWKRIK